MRGRKERNQEVVGSLALLALLVACLTSNETKRMKLSSSSLAFSFNSTNFKKNLIPLHQQHQSLRALGVLSSRFKFKKYSNPTNRYTFNLKTRLHSTVHEHQHQDQKQQQQHQQHQTQHTTNQSIMSSANMGRGMGGRIEQAFATAKDKGEAAFVSFVTAGYPSIQGER